MRCLHCHCEDIGVSESTCPGCGVYLPTLMRDILPSGTLLHDGKYRIDFALGRGGFGITYQASHAILEQAVAVKEFFPQELALRNTESGHLSIPTSGRVDYEKWLQRFMQEGRILARLTHPNVVRVSDLFEDRGTAYLVMELLSGPACAACCRQSPETGWLQIKWSGSSTSW